MDWGLWIGGAIILYAVWQYLRARDRQHQEIVALLQLIHRDTAAGLGVNIDQAHGHLDGGDLRKIEHEIRRRR